MNVMCAGVTAEEFVSTSEASETSGYSQDYIGQLCREGKISCRRVSGQWHVNLDSLGTYQRTVETDEETKDGNYINENKEVQNGVGDTIYPAYGSKTGNVRDDTFTYDGVEFISTQRAADLTGYAQDYVGQLARSQEVIARRVGRRWFVSRPALITHKKNKDGLLQAVQARSAGIEKLQQFEGNGGEDVPINRVSDARDLNFRVRYITETHSPLPLSSKREEYEVLSMDREEVRKLNPFPNERQLPNGAPRTNTLHNMSQKRSAITSVRDSSIRAPIQDTQEAFKSESRLDKNISQDTFFVSGRESTGKEARKPFRTFLLGVILLAFVGAGGWYGYQSYLIGELQRPEAAFTGVFRFLDEKYQLVYAFQEHMKEQYGEYVPGKSSDYMRGSQ
jgi:hypothetical protein